MLLTITENFGRLTFSFFSFSFGVEGAQAWFSIGEPPPIDQELIDVYMDRDMSAAGVDFTEVLGVDFSIDRVLLPHDGKGFKRKIPAITLTAPSSLVALRGGSILVQICWTSHYQKATRSPLAIFSSSARC